MENEIFKIALAAKEKAVKSIKKSLKELGLDVPLRIDIMIHNVPKQFYPIDETIINITKYENWNNKRYFFLASYKNITLSSEWADVELPAENTDGLLDDYNQDLYLIEA